MIRIVIIFTNSYRKILITSITYCNEILTHEISNFMLQMKAMEITNSDFIGGAVRYVNGKWNQNCYQMVYRNYSIRYFSGYENSENECLSCDMFLGPIFGKTKKLKNIKFDEKMNDAIVSPDFFLKVN